MPHARPQDLPPAGGGRWPAVGNGFRSTQWGDLEVGFTVTGIGDHTALYVGLPGGVCPVPHYGYMLAGRIRCSFPGTDWPDEVAEAGEAYFFPAGHVLIYEQETEALEFNPASALQTLMDHIDAKARQYAAVREEHPQ